MGRYLHYIWMAVLLLTAVLTAHAQYSRHIIYLKNKNGTAYQLNEPARYLSAKAIERRAKNFINIDSLDLPVSAAYVQQIAAVPGVQVLNVSRWLNAVAVRVNNTTALPLIAQLSFVQASVPVAALKNGEEKYTGKWKETDVTGNTHINIVSGKTGDVYTYGYTQNEMKLHNAVFLHNIGLTGSGITIAMLDAGYAFYKTLTAFDSIRLQGRILSTWDFVEGKEDVSQGHLHGTMCLSVIAAHIPGQFVGKAPGASFHLFRTEDDASEYPVEEFNWVCGAERADSSGAAIISSSLGYYWFNDPVFNYSYAQLDGKTTISAKGAAVAARKGILVVNSAGNEGNTAWQKIITPSDGDSVLCVAAVDVNGNIGSFSSYGFRADGTIKPQVASVGVSAVVQTSNNQIVGANGTSFSCPNISGLAACLWQGFPEINNMKIIDILQKSGTTYSQPNNRTGYGIPDMKKAFEYLLQNFATAGISVNNCVPVISWQSKDVGAMRYEIEYQPPGESVFTNIGTIQPALNAVLKTNAYNFMHNNIVLSKKGTGNYRIKQITDTTAAGYSFIYIDTLAFNTDNCVYNGPDDALVAPNPATGNAELILKSNEGIEQLLIQVFNSNGALLYSAHAAKGPGISKQVIPSEKWAAAVYFIKVYATNKLIKVLKFVKL